MGVLSEESSNIISQFKSKNLLPKINLVIEFGHCFLFLEDISIILSTIFSGEYLFSSSLCKYSNAFDNFRNLLHSLKIKAFSIVDYLFINLLYNMNFDLLYILLSFLIYF